MQTPRLDLPNRFASEHECRAYLDATGVLGQLCTPRSVMDVESLRSSSLCPTLSCAAPATRATCRGISLTSGLARKSGQEALLEPPDRHSRQFKAVIPGAQ